MEDVRAFHDTAKARDLVYGNVVDALKAKSGVEHGDHRLDISNVRIAGPTTFTLKQQKDALISGRSLRTPVKGTVVLSNIQTGEVLDKVDQTLMHVPYYTDRGTIVNKGNDYTITNQSRLKPGTYTRRRKSGEYETQFNVRPGTGSGYRMWMEPSTGIFRVNIQQANVPAHYFLRSLGVTDKQMAEAWGPELYEANIKKTDTKAVDKLYQRLVKQKARVEGAAEAEKIEAIRESVVKAELDPWVVERTMGMADKKTVSPDLLLRSTRKLIGVSRGEENTDDRDNPAFSNILSVEDFLPERIEKDAGQTLRTILWKAKRKNNLEHFKAGGLNPYMEGFILNSGMAMPGEETNVMSTMDQAYRIVKLGEGGLGSDEAVTDEARDVNPGQVGFIDTVAGPECFDGRTEVLTVAGWKYWPDVKEDDWLLSKLDGKVVFQKPERLIREKYEGPMYGIHGDFFDKMVTPGHHIWACLDGASTQQMYAMEWLYTRVMEADVKKAGFELSTGTWSFNVPKEEIPIDSKMFDHCELFYKTDEERRIEIEKIEQTEDVLKTVEESECYQMLMLSVGRNKRTTTPVNNKVKLVETQNYAEVTKQNFYKVDFKGTVYCATVRGGMLYVRRGKETSGIWSGNSSRIGIDVRAAYKTFKGRDKQVYAPFTDVKTGKEVMLKPEDMISGTTLAFPGEDLSKPNNTVYAIKDGKFTKIKAKEVDYQVPSLSHMTTPSVTMTPMPTAYMASRMFYGAKYQSQLMPLAEGEAPLVQTMVPDGTDRTFQEYYGRKIGSLNSPIDGEVTRITKDHVVIQGEDGKKKFVETIKNFPFNRLTGISYNPTVKVGDKLKEGDMLAHSNFTNRKGVLSSGRNLRTAIIPGRGTAFEDAYTISEEAAQMLSSERLYGFDAENRFGKKVSRKTYISAFPNKFTNDQLGKINEEGVIKKGMIVKKGDPLILQTGPKVLSAEDAKLGKLHKVLRNTFRDEAMTWEHDYEGVVTDINSTTRGANVYVKAVAPVVNGDKLVNAFASKGITAKILPATEMPRNAKTGDPYHMIFNPMAVLSRVAANQVMDAKLGKIAKLTGKTYKIPAEAPKEGWKQFVQNELDNNNISDTEDIYDPQSGKTIANQGDGYMYMSAFHHLAEKKLCLTGDTEVFTANKGWILIEAVAVGDVVLTLDPETKLQQFQNVTHVYKYVVDGEPLYQVVDDSQDLEGTGDHRFFVNGGLATGTELYECDNSLRGTA